MNPISDYAKKAIADSLTFVSIEPVKERRFGYRVTFDLIRRSVTGRVSTVVSFPHGKRERTPHIDEVVAKAKSDVISDLAIFGKGS